MKSKLTIKVDGQTGEGMSYTAISLSSYIFERFGGKLNGKKSIFVM
jgi:hypothetical protein